MVGEIIVTTYDREPRNNFGPNGLLDLSRRRGYVCTYPVRAPLFARLMRRRAHGYNEIMPSLPQGR
jgi:hypothetical protein